MRRLVKVWIVFRCVVGFIVGYFFVVATIPIAYTFGPWHGVGAVLTAVGVFYVSMYPWEEMRERKKEQHTAALLERLEDPWEGKHPWTTR